MNEPKNTENTETGDKEYFESGRENTARKAEGMAAVLTICRDLLKTQKTPSGVNAGDAAPETCFCTSPPPWKMRLRRVLFFLPSFEKRSLVFRLAVGLLLLGFVFALASVKFGQHFELLRAALRYDPVEHAQALYDSGKKVACLNFIKFYVSIPVPSEHPPALHTLAASIEEERGSWTYRFNETWKGLKGVESEEIYGKSVDMLTEFVSLGDVRTLYREGGKALRGEDVNKLDAGLATIGVGMTLASLGPQAPTVAPFKSFTAVIKKCSNIMPPGLKQGIIKSFEPLATLMTKYPMVVSGASAVLDKETMRVMYKTAKEIGAEAAQHVRAGVVPFADFIVLASKQPDTAVMVVKYSDDVPALTRNSKLVSELGADAWGILAHGGKPGLQTAEILQKNNILSGNTLKKAMLYGESGLEWVRSMPVDDLLFKVRAIRTSVSGKMWYAIQSLLSFIPLPVALGLMVAALLTLFKMMVLHVPPAYRTQER